MVQTIATSQTTRNNVTKFSLKTRRANIFTLKLRWNQRYSNTNYIITNIDRYKNTNTNNKHWDFRIHNCSSF